MRHGHRGGAEASYPPPLAGEGRVGAMCRWIGSETAIGSLAGKVSIKASSSASYQSPPGSLASAAGFGRNLVELSKVGRGKSQPNGAEVFLQVLDPGRSRNRQHYRRMCQQPGESHLARGRMVAARDLLDDGRSPEIATGDRAPWQESRLLERAK